MAGVAPLVGLTEVVVRPKSSKVGDTVTSPVPDADGAEGGVAAARAPAAHPAGRPMPYGSSETVPTEVTVLDDGGSTGVAPSTRQVLRRSGHT